MNTTQRLLPFAPWHTPRERPAGNGVYVTTVYGSHALAAAVYGIWRVLVRRESWTVPGE